MVKVEDEQRYSNMDGDVKREGRKKVYTVVQPLELTLPDGSSDGTLDVGDLIYVIKKITLDGVKGFRFRAMKFMDSDKESNQYTAERSYFTRYFNDNGDEIKKGDNSSSDGDNQNQDNNNSDDNNSNDNNSNDDNSQSSSKSDSSNKPKGKKSQYVIPLTTAIAGGFVGNVIGNKFQKNAIVWGIGGLVVGWGVGMIIIKYNEQKKNNSRNNNIKNK